MVELPIGFVASVDDETGPGFASINDRIDQTQANVGGLGETSGVAFAAVAAGAVAGAAAVGAVVSESFEASREIDNLSRISRVNAEDLQAMSFVARQTGGSMEDVADASRELQLRLSEAASLGSGPAVDALNLLGISLDEIGRLDTADQLALIRDRLSEVEDPAQRAFLAEELLGGATERLTGFLELNAEAFRDQTVAARESGQVISQDTVDANVAAANAVDGLFGSLRTLGAELVGRFAPAIETTADVLTTVTGALADASEAEAEAELRAYALVRAQELATQSTVDLSFGTVGLKGEFEDLGEQIEIVIRAIEAADMVYSTFRNRSDEVVVSADRGTVSLGYYADAFGNLNRQAVAAAAALDAVRQAQFRSRTFSEAESIGADLTAASDINPALALARAEAFRVSQPTTFFGGSRAVGGGGSRLSAEEIAEQQEDRERQRFAEQIEALYATNRLSEDQYEALTESNDLGATLNELVQGASADELRALDQVRGGLFRLGELTAGGSRQIVQAIDAVRAAVGDDTVEPTLTPTLISGRRFVDRRDRSVDSLNRANRNLLFDLTGADANDNSPMVVNVVVDGRVLATAQISEVQRALDRGELTIRTT